MLVLIALARQRTSSIHPSKPIHLERGASRPDGAGLARACFISRFTPLHDTSRALRQPMQGDALDKLEQSDGYQVRNDPGRVMRRSRSQHISAYIRKTMKGILHNIMHHPLSFVLHGTSAVSLLLVLSFSSA